MNAIQTPSSQYLSFFVGDEEFGLSILEAREITQFPAVTKVPTMSEAVRGVINLRGSVVPVIDLARHFELTEKPADKWSCVVIVDGASLGAGTGLVGLLVDRMSQVLELSDADIEPAPEFGTRVDRPFLRGLGRAGKKFVLLLHLGAVLSGLQTGRVDEGDSTAADASADAAPEAT